MFVSTPTNSLIRPPISASRAFHAAGRNGGRLSTSTVSCRLGLTPLVTRIGKEEAPTIAAAAKQATAAARKLELASDDTQALLRLKYDEVYLAVQLKTRQAEAWISYRTRSLSKS